MDIEWLRCFLLCSEYKSFSKVAEHFHITQPAVSKQIKKLEDELGVELLSRSSQGIKLTEAGIHFQKRIIPFVEEWDSIRKEMKGMGESIHVVLGLLPSLAAFYLPEKIIGGKSENINIETKVYDMSKEIMEEVVSGKLDAGLVDEKWVPKHLWNRQLFVEPYDVVFPEKHSFSKKEDVFINELLIESFVMYPIGCDIRRAIIEEFERLKAEPNISSEVSFRDFILGMVAAGAGITIVPRTISERIEHLPLRTIPIRDFQKQRAIYLIARNERVGKALFKMFTETTL
ncbi:LysR family transcriptional regulator [Bacillus pseudomycoides]|uniref:HTH-type transcriptional regulator CzcR n=1 Tax=Bacillus pseudomycoides TaxID=64104 RepID=A0AA91VBY3_9BACI|nr:MULTISPECIES: LysR family transcriptional regulator [Bacillus]PEB51885.1 LysR family transcriptional regulator [Bacillus sp. AFS098217]PED81828.1 LysR family transcriptional regulator [Bacillus pseudomycoides]PEU15256.1 LysR family transcriptional regulator [Bacillus sp. AFS014408]PEU17859.1 LysR family transcriptional regulator [Bacillus sp. AFS019443]PFW63344.1 LysR family transcriptional regulator [Bacillus sp. AFS075034]